MTGEEFDFIEKCIVAEDILRSGYVFWGKSFTSQVDEWYCSMSWKTVNVKYISLFLVYIYAYKTFLLVKEEFKYNNFIIVYVYTFMFIFYKKIIF